MNQKIFPVFPYSKILKNCKILIYGAGAIGKALIMQVQKNKYCNIIAVVDKRAKEIHEILGVRCIELEQTKHLDFDYIVIAILKNYGIKEELSQYCNKDKIIQLTEEDYYTENESEILQILIDHNGFLPLHLKRKNMDFHSLFGKLVKSSKLLYKPLESRVLSIDDSITKLFINVVKYRRDYFWITNEEFGFVGNIDLNDYETRQKITDQSRISDLVNKDNVRCIDTRETIDDVLQKLYQYPGEEVAVVDSGRLVGILNRMDIYMLCGEHVYDEYQPTISRAYCHEKQTFPLWEKYMYNKNSQTGEDGIIEEIFKRIGFESKYFCEFGAWDGEFLSNSKNLIDKYEFSGLFIEGDSKRAQDGIEKYEKISDRVHYATGFVQHRKEKLLDQFLEEDGAPIDVDFLSIDIDGYDYHVWNSLEKYRPRVVCIEYNQYTPNSIIEIPPLDESQSVGASALALVELGTKKGYQLAAATIFNLIFVVNEEFAKLGIVDNSLDVMKSKEADFDNTWFESFQGEIFNTGKCTSFELTDKKFISNRFSVETE